MKRAALLSACIGILFCPAASPAAETGVDATTIFRMEQRDVPGSSTQTLLPATQFLTVDFDKLADGNLSLHLSGWGRVDAADKSYNDRTADGNVSYGYLQYRFDRGNGVAKAGRFFVFEGVANEQLDGAYVRGDFAKGIGASVFGGTPVSSGSAEDRGSYIVGGRAHFRGGGKFELGASVVREGNVTTVAAGENKNLRQLVGADIWISPHRVLEVTGHTYYNTVTSGVAENSYLASVKPTRELTVFAEYNENRLRDLFATTSLRTIFTDPTLGDRFRSVGGGATYRVAKPVEITVDYKNYHRDLGSSNRYGGEVRLVLLENTLRSGVSFHRLSAGGGINSYNEARAFTLHDAKAYFASLDAIGQFYSEPMYGKKHGYLFVGSLGYQILPGLVLSGDVSYGSNPQFTEEVKGLLRLTYAANYSAKGAKK
jgi:hypothetical protein